MALGWIADIFSGSPDTSSSDSNHNTTSRNPYVLEGRNNLRERENMGCVSCEDCRWYEGNSCRWQGNCYAPAGKYHEYVCDNFDYK